MCLYTFAKVDPWRSVFIALQLYMSESNNIAWNFLSLLQYRTSFFADYTALLPLLESDIWFILSANSQKYVKVKYTVFSLQECSLT